MKRCRDLPGQDLFQYLDDDGQAQTIDSADVNAYLREVSGEDFTAKDFRTWAGTVLAALALQEFETFDSEAQAKKNIVRAIESVAERLGNTPTVCRKCYVHPAIIQSYMDGTMLETLKTRAEREMSDSLGELRPEEAAILALLQQRLARDVELAREKARDRRLLPRAFPLVAAGSMTRPLGTLCSRIEGTFGGPNGRAVSSKTN